MKKHGALLPFLLIAVTAGAEERFYPYTDRPLDFSVRFSQHDLDLDYGSARIDTSVDRIGIGWRERYGDRLQLGLIAGWTDLTQTNNPVSAGRELEGYHAGVSLDFDLLRFERVTVFVQGAFLYQRVDDDTSTQRIVIAWREPSAQLGAAANLGGGLSVYGGVRYGRIDGEQRSSGTLNETREIEESERGGAVAGLELRVEGDGYIGFSAASGTDQTFALYFGRRF